MISLQILILVTLCIPLPSNQHFVWPLSMCVLADICNHTWIPECGRERSDNSMRLFIDECDLFEYSCDYNLHYEIMNYSDCFMGPASCPPVIPCPSHPTCPNHRFHRMGQHYFYITDARRMARPPVTTTKINLPLRMLRGKRRYTPTPRCVRAKARQTTKQRTIPKNKNIKSTRTHPTTKMMAKLTILETMILKRETVLKNGRIFVKVVKGLASKKATNNMKKDSDFLE